MSSSRRRFLQTTTALAATALAARSTIAADKTTPPPATTPTSKPATTKNSRPSFAVIGCGGIARFHAVFIRKYGDIVAICDVDRDHLASYNKDFNDNKAWTTADYREILSPPKGKPAADLVLIATPDHWHSKIAIDAMRAGKDVYCEKPLTLTIDEGRTVARVNRETSRILQVGTQQRSDERFVTAVALAHAGRLGKIRQVTCVIGDTPPGTNFPVTPPPADLDWDTWLGQAPRTPYIKQRSHYDFRWWYEYSGGRITDWGAHHVDIAQWAVAPDLPGPVSVEPVAVTLPMRFDRGYPTASNGFNTATHFNIKCTFANGVDLFIRDKVDNFPSDNGILIEGDGGYLFVNRQTLSGPAVNDMKENPLPEGAVRKLPLQIEQPHERHMLNFIECARTRTQPASDFYTHHKHLTTCHLANIAMRLNRKIKWDATAQEIVNDAEADTFQSRLQRKGYEVI